MDKSKTYYEILGVSEDATLSAIKRAYRQLAKRCHPDVAVAHSTEEFCALKRAYETLTDAESRRRYDRTLESAPSRLSRTPRPSFARDPGCGALRRRMEPVTVSGEVFLDAREAAKGGTLLLDVPVAIACPSCVGTGGAFFSCLRCNGDGTIERRFPVSLQVPSHAADGSVFQVMVDHPSPITVLLVVHVSSW